MSQAWLGGFRTREALTIGFGMNSRGAMEILLAMLALEAKIISTHPAMAKLVRPTPSP